MFDVDLVIFDLDGVIYRDKEPMPYAAEGVARLRAEGYAVRFMSNNSSVSRHTFAQRLKNMGIQCAPEEFMSSSVCAAYYLAQQGAKGKSAFVVGMEGLRAELISAGIELVDDPDEEHTDYVVAGIDWNFTYETLRKALTAIINGAEFIATNQDATFPGANGSIRPGAGSIIAAIERASGVTPITVGKPNPLGIVLLIDELKTCAERTLLIGDRMDTDIALGRDIGLKTALVTTGVSQLEDALQADQEHRPHVVIDSIEGLWNNCYQAWPRP